MIPSSFEYHSPASIDEALSLLGRFGDGAKLLAGGHSLVPLMKLRLAAPEHLIDMERIDGLSYIREEGSHIAIGALTTHAELAASSLLRRTATAVSEAAASIGDVQVRNRGTIGGSLAHADPGADQPGVMLAVDASFVAQSSRGTRTIHGYDFFTDLLTTSLAEDEILTQVRIPVLPENSGSAYVKMANPASGYAIVGLSAVVTVKDDKVSYVRVGISGVAETAKRAAAVENMLRGQSATAEAVKQAAQRAGSSLEALGDIHASADFRLHLVKVYAERALTLALSRARGG